MEIYDCPQHFIVDGQILQNIVIDAFIFKILRIGSNNGQYPAIYRYLC